MVCGTHGENSARFKAAILTFVEVIPLKVKVNAARACDWKLREATTDLVALKDAPRWWS
jgi:hypothetical protein